ncbi:15-hydroxyprostaglandin dehydrogenase [NAD(+)]-like [Periplaneta americana]|uniref:15-hydroxyprostaglandin dehydrogenase [NAD(+)]-like n=1 Tax=Periplaneta americana TaxID=6978 RepID=UPI0037E92646
MDPNGKIALVTGGAMGIGFSICQELLKAGVKAVIICDLDKQKGEAAVKNLSVEYGKDKVKFIKTDVTNSSEFEDAFKTTVGLYGGLDIVVNNAGISNDRNWEKEVQINLMAVIRGTLLGLQHMGKDKGGKGGIIVNMASICGIYALPPLPMYTAAKHGVVALSRSLGTEYHYNATGVRLAAMCPGITSTVLYNETVNNVYEDKWGEEWDRIRAEMKEQGPEYVAKGVVQLVRNAKSGSVWVSEECKPIYEVKVEVTKLVE